MNTLKKILTAITFSSMCVAFTVSATPIVTDWDFIVDTAFTSSELTGGGGSAVGSDYNAYWTAEEGGDTPTTLTWGHVSDTDEQSSISVADGGTGHTEGTLMTNGIAMHTATLEHNNNAISTSFDTLMDATLSTHLFLNPLLPAVPYAGVPIFGTPALHFDIQFTETFNGGTCAVDTSPTPCNDIFVIDLIGGAGGTTFDPSTNTFNQIFPLFEYHYNAQIIVEGLDTLSDPVCAAAGAASGCIGITTAENVLNSFEVKLRISLVPEPSVILLMALALIGIFASMRNKHI